MQELNEQQYLEMRQGADVMAADHHGDKVLLLADGTYLKLFRIKRLLTSARLFPYWRRFEKNVAGLRQLGIPTLVVKAVYDLPFMKRTGVHYDPLPGKTLREVAFDKPLARKLGSFIRVLHDRGVYLRSMHLGNVVMTPQGELGLIDVADMRIHRRALSGWHRFRNFHHLCRYEEDRKRVYEYIDAFLEAFEESDHQRLRDMFAATA